jgi:hypothetical protein
LPVAWSVAELALLTVQQMLITAVIFVTFLMSVGYILRIMFRNGRQAGVIVGLYAFLIALVPILVDFVRIGLSAEGQFEDLGPITAASPLGALIICWGGYLPQGGASGGAQINPYPGLIVQAGLTGLWALLFHATERRVRPPAARPA